MRFARRAMLLCALVSANVPLHAAEWQQEIAPYVWGAGMNGTAGVRGVTGDVDASFGDVLDNLEVGFMGMYRATKDRFSVTVDGVYMGLGATGRGPNDLVEADIDMDQAALEVDLGYKLTEHFTVFGGVRYNDLSVAVKTTGPLESRRAAGSESWVDPVVGAHYVMPLSETWSTALRGDIGGFGVGSDFAWQGIATLRWQSTPTFGVLAAYRYMSMDYESGAGSNALRYDMAMSGPAVGVVFTF